MKKKIFKRIDIGKMVVFVLLFVIFGMWMTVLAQMSMDGYEGNLEDNFNIYTPDLESTINTDVTSNQDISDPLRQWAYHVVNAQGESENKLDGIIDVDNEITDHSTAKAETMQLIKRGVNYALGLASLVALVFLLYHGFLMVTAAGDDGQYKKGLKGLKTAMIALFGMGLSWFIVSMIFWLIDTITG